MRLSNYTLFIILAVVVILFLLTLKQPQHYLSLVAEREHYTTTNSVTGQIVMNSDTGILLDQGKQAVNITASDILFYGGSVQNTERMRIQGSTGYLGIGTTIPSDPLSVAGNASISGNMTSGSVSTSGAISGGSLSVSGTSVLSGNVGIGTQSSSDKLTVFGIMKSTTKVVAPTAQFTGITSATPSLALGVDASGNLNSFPVPTSSNILALNNTWSGTNTFSNTISITPETSTASYTLGLNSSNQIIKYAVSNGTFSGSVSSNYIPYTSSLNTFSNSIISQGSGQINVGGAIVSTSTINSGGALYSSVSGQATLAMTGGNGNYGSIEAYNTTSGATAKRPLCLNLWGGSVVIGPGRDGATSLTNCDIAVSRILTSKVFTITATSISTFYPVYFNTQCSFDNGNPWKVSISRPSVHTDASWRGSFMLTIEGHNTHWGNASDYITWNYNAGTVPPSSYNIFVSNVIQDPTTGYIVVWLRGGSTSYHISGEGVDLNNMFIPNNSTTFPISIPGGTGATYTTQTTTIGNWAYPNYFYDSRQGRELFGSNPNNNGYIDRAYHKNRITNIYYPVDGDMGLIISNTSATSNAYTQLLLQNDYGYGAVHFLNSNSRSVDGGTSCYTIRNDIGAGIRFISPYAGGFCSFNYGTESGCATNVNSINNYSGTFGYNLGSWSGWGYTLFMSQSTTSCPSPSQPALGIGTNNYNNNYITSLAPGARWMDLYINAKQTLIYYETTLVAYSYAYSWAIVSDAREKEDIKDIKTSRSLERVLKCKPKTYRRKTYSKTPTTTPEVTCIGLLAQDMKDINPHCISPWENTEIEKNTEDDGMRMGISYNDWVVHLIGATQEQQKIIDTQKQQIDTLTERTNLIEKQLAQSNKELQDYKALMEERLNNIMSMITKNS